MAPHSDQGFVLFLPINAAGHINSSVAIADRLRADHHYRTAFLLVGPAPSSEISSHGHELIELEDADPIDDYEVDPDEDTSQPVDEERMKQLGRRKRRFVGAEKYAQLTARYRHYFECSPGEAYKQRARLVGQHLVPGVIACNAAVEREIGRLNPDLIICDLYLPPPRVLLEEHKRPWVRLQTGNPLVLVQPKAGMPAIKPASRIYTKEERERIRREEPDRWQRMLEEWRRLSEAIADTNREQYVRMREFYQAHGCDRLDPGMPAVNSPHLNLYLFPEALDYDQDDDLLEYPAGWLRCDSLMRHQQPEGIRQKVEIDHWSSVLEERRRERPKLKVIFFSVGSIASGDLKKMRRLLEIFAHDPEPDHLYVVSKGVNGDKIRLNERNMIGANYLPQLFFLNCADLAIIHGGNNTVTECLYYGQPSIVLPVLGDQFDNAWRIQDMKLGRAMDVHNCTKQELLGAIVELLADHEMKRRVQDISKRMKARDELAKLSEVLSGLLKEGRISEEKAVKHGIRLR